MKNPIYKVQIKWYYAILCGFCSILDGIVMLLSFGNLCSDLQLRAAILGAKKSWCNVTPKEEQRYQEASIKVPKASIDYVDNFDRFQIDGDGDIFDDYGTGLSGYPETNI